jgi:hypothetical protein
LKEFAMRLYAPIYEGDSILRADSAIGAPVRRVAKSPAVAADFVRSNIKVESAAANPVELDILALEQTAHALRNAEVARLLKIAASSIMKALDSAQIAVENWLERVEYEERDNFFAGASNLADLENRQRHWERTGCTHY